MKKLNFLFSFIFVFLFVVNANSQLTVPGTHANLKLAFDDINAGTFTGAVTIDITGNSTVPATAVLNASGFGAASYISVTITPSGGSWTIDGSLAGATTGSIIRLAGADRVTIDGRIAGTGRNLTINNTSALTNQCGVFLSSVITVNVPTTLNDTNGCENNVIRNLNVSCNLPQNTLTAPLFSLGVSSGSIVFTTATGILSGGIGSAGRRNNNNQYIENNIVKVRYGIFLGGGSTASTLNQSNVIQGNIIGPAAFGVDQIGKIGIYVNGQNNSLIQCNYIQNVGRNDTVAGLTAGADRCGIGLGQENWSSTSTSTLIGTNNVVNANTIINVVETREFSAVGIICASSASVNGGLTNNLISNNIIYNVKANGTAPDQGVGLGYIGGSATINANGDKVVYNSIYMTGLVDPAPGTASTQNTIGIKINSLSTTNDLILKNNSVYVDVTSRTATVLHYCIAAPATTYAWGTGGCNNNDYYFSAANAQMRTGGLGAASPLTSSFTTLALWQPVFTSPGPQDGASIQADPLYNLLPFAYPLMPMPGSPLLSAGAPIPGVLFDAYVCTDPQQRSLINPTIGAWEYNDVTNPVELSSFVSNVTGRDVTLNWATATEINNAGFDIERKNNNSEAWSKIGNVTGNGTISTPQDYTFTDRGLSSGKYKYRLKQIDFNGNFEYFNLSNEVGVGVPEKYSLSQNYPNPFNPTTKIGYDMPTDGKVSLRIFDMSGKEVASLINEVQTAGYYTINFNASNLSSGVYFYSISAGNFTATKKMMLLK